MSRNLKTPAGLGQSRNRTKRKTCGWWLLYRKGLLLPSTFYLLPIILDELSQWVFSDKKIKLYKELETLMS